MLFTMPGTAATPLKTANFASLLAGYASPSRVAEWPADGLEDDVATISYEKALRKHARTRPSEPLPGESTPAAQKTQSDIRAVAPRSAPSKRKPAVLVRTSEWVPPKAPVAVKPAAPPRAKQARKVALVSARKSASLTVRLTAEENAQLHERAAAAGITASAYLRSCVFEAESLRAQVKQALEQFRAGAYPSEKRIELPAPVQPAPQTRRFWQLSRWFGFIHARSA
jgi:hypothetical protein